MIGTTNLIYEAKCLNNEDLAGCPHTTPDDLFEARLVSQGVATTEKLIVTKEPNQQ